jgi:hypothetical protein
MERARDPRRSDEGRGRLLDLWLGLARSTATADASLLPDVAGGHAGVDTTDRSITTSSDRPRASTLRPAGSETESTQCRTGCWPRRIRGQVLGTGLRFLREAQGSSREGASGSRNGLVAGKTRSKRCSCVPFSQPESSMVRRGSTVRVRQRALLSPRSTCKLASSVALASIAEHLPVAS